jgi:hypothetical protein
MYSVQYLVLAMPVVSKNGVSIICMADQQLKGFFKE